MSAPSTEKIEKVIKSGLCTRCGSCVGLSNGAINFADREGDCLPHISAEPDAVRAARIAAACAGAEADFNALNTAAFGADAGRHEYLGHFESIGIGHADDPQTRSEGASGGVLTAILLWLLERGEIDGAVVTGMDERRPWLPKTFIARNAEEIRAAAQSKYVITTVNEILPEMEAFTGRLAYVGLPCQVHSIRRMQAAGDTAVKSIRFVFGPFCGNTLHFSSIKSLLRSYGEKDHTCIKRLDFRAGEWPGSLRIEMQSGRVIELPKFHANYLIPFHIMKRCLLCTDLANEFTDISGGDVWAPVYEERGRGFSMVFARSAEGSRIIREMQESGALSLASLEPDEALKMHSHGYDLKKRGAFIRMEFLTKLGLAVPDYGYELSGFKPKRYVMEAVLDQLFLLFGTRVSRAALEHVNPEHMGAIFQRLRTLWKKSTHNIKREQLGE